MNGRAEVHRLTQVLDATFKRATTLVAAKIADPELQSDFARYLCVSVSGFVDRAVIELILDHTRKQAAPSVLRFVESRTKRLNNFNTERLLQVIGSLDPDWRKDLEGFLDDKSQAALNSIVNLRNAIVHGQSVSVTLARVKEYYEQTKRIVDHVAQLCVT